MMKKIAVIGIPGGWSSERLADTLEMETGFRCLIDMGKVRLDLDTGRAYADDLCLNDLDGIIVKKISPAYSPNCLDRMEILNFLHERGIPVFSRPRSILALIDRLSCTLRLRAGGMPMPPTIITEDTGEALSAVERFGKAVFKPLYSSKARGMMVIEAGVGRRGFHSRIQGRGKPPHVYSEISAPGGSGSGGRFPGRRVSGHLRTAEERRDLEYHHPFRGKIRPL